MVSLFVGSDTALTPNEVQNTHGEHCPPVAKVLEIVADDKATEKLADGCKRVHLCRRLGS